MMFRGILAHGPDIPWPAKGWDSVGWTRRQMAGAIGASLLIVAALTVAMVSALTSVGEVQSPFVTATNASAVPALESPAISVVATPADSAPATVDVSGGPGLLPQERRCPCP
ncbi:hypothetical protein [Oryzihumus sp.]